MVRMGEVHLLMVVVLLRGRGRPSSLRTTASSPRTPPLQAAVVTRYAPSPTGALHLGGLRTALYK